MCKCHPFHSKPHFSLFQTEQNPSLLWILTQTRGCFSSLHLIPRSQLFHLVFFLSTFPSNFVLSTSEPASSSTPTFAIPHFAIFVQSHFCYCNFCRCHSERSRLFSAIISRFFYFSCNIISVVHLRTFSQSQTLSDSLNILVYSRLFRPFSPLNFFARLLPLRSPEFPTASSEIFRQTL